MQTNDQSFKTSEYWMETIQNELRNQVKKYMDEKGLNPSQLAKELGVAKSYITQVLKGKFNYSLSKLIDLCLAVGVVPGIEFKSLHEFTLQKEKKQSKLIMNVRAKELLAIKVGKIKVPLLQNENGVTVSLDVNQVSTITPSETKIA